MVYLRGSDLKIPNKALISDYFTLFISDLRKAEIPQYAYAMAYYTLISLVPSLILIFSLISLFTPIFGENSFVINDLRHFILENLATGSGEQVITYLEAVIARVDIKTLGFTGFFGTLITLVFLLQSIEVALNRIFAVTRRRNIFTRFVYFWTILTLGTFLLAMIVGVFSGFNLNANGFTEMSSHPLAGGFAYFLGLIILFTLIYKIVPNKYVEFSHAVYGAFGASLFLLIAGLLFRSYTKMFTNYQAIYGAALSALPIFLIWIYLNWVIILSGALLTRRFQLGSSIEVEQTFLDDLPSESAAHIQNLTRSHLPFLVLWKIYHDLHAGGFIGFNPQVASKDFSMPEHWLQEAVETLERCGFVTTGQSVSEGLALAYFPTIASDQLSLETFFERLEIAFEVEWEKLLGRLSLPYVNLPWLTKTDLSSKTFDDLLKA